MPTTQLLSLITFASAVLTFFWFSNRLYGNSSSPLSRIPNAHFSAPFSRLWLTWLKGTGHEHRTRHAAHKRLGPVIRLGPNELSINCIENGVSTVYGGNFDKAAWYENFLNYGKLFMFAMGPAKLHSERRRMLAHVYTNSYVQSSPELDQIITTMLYERLLPQVRAWARTGAAVNAHEENKAYNMDCNSAYFFGLGNGTNCVQNPHEKKLLRAFEQGMSGLFWFAEAPRLATWLSYIGVKVLPDTVLQSYKLMEDLALDMCKAAKESMASESLASEESFPKVPAHPTVYAQLRTKLQESGVSPDALDDTVAAELLDHLQAGHEASGIVLTYLMGQLSTHPAALQNLRQEISALQQPEPASSSAQAIDKLQFLDAVLMETMRLHPGSFGPFPRYVPAKGARLGDFDGIPAGCTVSTSAYSLHRNETVFPEPEAWRPERWVNATDTKRKEMQKWFWAFGSGSRMCIGNHLAIRLMKAFIVAIYSECDVNIIGEPVQQTDGLMGFPLNHRMMMTFRPIKS